MANYKELKSQAEDLMRQAETARKLELVAALAEIKEKMNLYGITLADLGGSSRVANVRKPKTANVIKPAKARKVMKTKPVKERSSVAAKYRNVSTGESWSGRGKLPKWLAALEAAGRKREEFAVR